MKRPARSRRAFTLVEVLVVVCILAVLAALLFPAFERVNAGAKAAACLSNLRQIGAGLTTYLGEQNQTMPSLQAARASTNEQVPVIDTVLLPYMKTKEVFGCPADPKYFQLTGTSYFWNPALNDQHVGSLTFMQLTELQSQIPVLSDKEGFHPYLENKVNVLYADGHVTKDLKFHTDKK